MFSIGDYVVYAADGVCQVVDIGPLRIKTDYGNQDSYYFLKPLFYKGMIYTPARADAPLRAVIERGAALELIHGLSDMPADAGQFSDKRGMTDYYKELLRENTCAAFAKAAKGIYEKYHAPGKAGKAPNAVETQYFKKASELLLQELSIALGEPVGAVERYIEAQYGNGKEELFVDGLDQ